MMLLNGIDRYAFSRLSPLSAVPRVVDPPADVFNRYFVDHGFPMIAVSGRIFRDGLPTLEGILASAGDIKVNVRGGNYAEVRRRRMRELRLAEYMQKFMVDPPAAADGALPDYAGNSLLSRGELESLGLRYPDVFERRQFEGPRLWMGPRGSLTPLHYDSRDNMICQYIGRKHVTLFPPSQIRWLYTWGFSPSWSRIADPREPDLEKYPLFARARSLSFVLNPGEVLYLPKRWAHFIVNLDPSVMVNFWPERTAFQRLRIRATELRWEIQGRLIKG
jgi:Cupin-like domain